jgi:hypothetical protein
VDFRGAIFDKVNSYNKKWTSTFKMIGGGINGRPTQNLNHKQMNSNGCLD